MSDANVPSSVLRNMYDHALSEKAEWERRVSEHTTRLASAVRMVEHWDGQIASIGTTLEARGEFSEFPEDFEPALPGTDKEPA